MIDMLKRHEIQVLRRAGHSQIEVATLAGVARRTVQRVDGEAAVTHIDSFGLSLPKSWPASRSCYRSKCSDGSN
jgi:hypothetical protein